MEAAAHDSQTEQNGNGRLAWVVVGNKKKDNGSIASTSGSPGVRYANGGRVVMVLRRASQNIGELNVARVNKVAREQATRSVVPTNTSVAILPEALRMKHGSFFVRAKNYLSSFHSLSLSRFLFCHTHTHTHPF